MRRTVSLLVVLVAILACHRGVGGPEAGATSSDGAVQQFLFAAKSQDLPAMSAVWGTAEGPLREREERRQLERRLLILICHLRHDESRMGAAQAGEEGKVMYRVEVMQGEKKGSPVFTTVKDRRTGRWFVESFDLPALQGFCTAGGAPPLPAKP